MQVLTTLRIKEQTNIKIHQKWQQLLSSWAAEQLSNWATEQHSKDVMNKDQNLKLEASLDQQVCHSRGEVSFDPT